MSGKVKNVLFIGLTQMGKSTLLKRILQYGGHETMADTVVEGNGHESQTQVVTSYAAQIKIQNHFMEHNKTGARIEPDAEADKKDYTNVSEETMEVVALNMIDTPGMSDSQGTKASIQASGRFKRTVGAFASIVDEQHKMRVLLHLNELSELHAIVFVIKFSQAYSESFQRILNSYLQLFEASTMKLAYHVVHTGVTPEEVFSGAVLTRETEFVAAFSLHATHHFLDNCPSKRNSIAIHQSRQNLANFLRSLARSQPTKISNLRYPKTEVIIQSEHVLDQTYECIATALEADIKKLDQDISDMTLERTRHENRYRTHRDRMAELHYQIRQLDTDVLVQVDEPMYKYKDWTWGNTTPYVKWEHTCKYPIAEVVKNSVSSGEWQAENLSGNTYSVYHQADRFENAGGTVTIKCKKHDVEADKISRLKAEMDREEAKQSDCLGQVTLYNSKVVLAVDEKVSKRLQLEWLRKDRLKLDITQNSFPVRKYAALLAHLVTGSIVCMAKAYELNFEFRLSDIAGHSTTDSQEEGNLEQERTRQLGLLALRREVVESILTQSAQDEQIMSTLTHHGFQYEERLSWLQENTNDVAVLGTSSRSVPLQSAVLSSIYDKMNQRVSTSIACVEEFIKAEATTLQQAGEMVNESKERLKLLIKESRALKLKWESSKAENQMALSAVAETKSLVAGVGLHIGVLAVLRKADAADDKWTYMALYDEVAEAMKADALQKAILGT